MNISYSAPAKVILSGEHAVVYGNPALVSTIDLRLKFYIWKEETKTTDKDILFISQKTKNYLKKEKINFADNPFNFKIKSEIPIGRGLGSSAALSSAAAASFLEFYTDQKFEKKIINKLAFQIEKHFHKNPSGVDNSAACFGGLILYQKQVGLTNLNNKIPENIEEKLFLIDSGKPSETTGEMVSLVKTKITKKILNEIKSSTKQLEKSINDENIFLFKESLIKNEKMLEEIGVVSQKTKKLLTELSRFGIGKVTGAGGRRTNSGFILFFAEDKKKLIEYLNTNKIIFYKFVPDGKGLTRL